MNDLNDYQRTGDTAKQGWSMKVEAWDEANIVAPALQETASFVNNNRIK